MPGSDEEKSEPVEEKAHASGEDKKDKITGNNDARSSGANNKEGDEEPPAPAADTSTASATNDPNSESNPVALTLQYVALSTGIASPIGDPATVLQAKDKDQKKDEETKEEATKTNPTKSATASTAAAAETAVLAAAKASADVKSSSAKPAAKKKVSAMKRSGRGGLVGKSNEDTEQLPSAPELPPLDVNFEELTADSYFTTIDMRGNVADSFFVAIAQMRPCGLTQDDRVGKYRQREIGFVGLCCRHCGGRPGFGRYFPGSCKL